MSYLGLAGNLISLFFILTIGFVSDRFQVWKLLSIMSFVVFVFYLMLMLQIWLYDGTQVGILYDVGYSMARGTYVVLYMLSITLLSKIVSAQSRGTMFSVNAFLNGVLIIAYDGIGGVLFSRVNKISPFLIAFSLLVIFMICTLVVGFMGKLRV